MVRQQSQCIIVGELKNDTAVQQNTARRSPEVAFPGTIPQISFKFSYKPEEIYIFKIKKLYPRGMTVKTYVFFVIPL